MCSAGESDESTVLLVEGDVVLGRSWNRALRRPGIDPLWALSGGEAVQLAQLEPPDLVLLQARIPRVEFPQLIAVLQEINENCVIVMYSDSPEDTDVITALEAGADDYFITPMTTRVLIARVTAHLRRLRDRSTLTPVLRSGELEVDLERRQARAFGCVMPMTPRQFDILITLVRDLGNVVPREALWGDAHTGGELRRRSKALDMQIALLRKRLAECGGPGVITTVREHGYRYDSTSLRAVGMPGRQTRRTPVDVGAVEAALVADDVALLVPDEHRMTARHGGVV